MKDRSRTILVADDDRTTRNVLAGLLSSEGFRVELADCGEKCLSLAQHHEVDAFLIDMRMPGLGGLGLCRELRAMERYRITPIIFITVLEEEQVLAEVFEAGATDFIAKPISPIILKARLQGHIQKAEYFLEMERVRRYLNRYVSTRTREVAQAYSRTEVLPLPQRHEVCVMFTDVRGFTALSRAVEPEILFDSISHLLGRQVETVHHYGGYIDKFGGDGIMAIFDEADKAARACQCALEIMHTVHQDQEAGGHLNLPVAIGIDMGQVLIGNIGSQEHLDYSAIGHVVNLASRLCSNAESLTIEVSGAVVAAAAKPPLVFSAPRPVKIRGITEPVSIYTLQQAEDNGSGASAEP